MRKQFQIGLLLTATVGLAACSHDDKSSEPGSVAFTAAAARVTEGTPNVAITVSRTGGNDGAVSVAYASTDATATSATDYAASTGTLTWADGDSADKTITIAITDDSAAEDDETFALTLSAPTGGVTLGAVNATTVTIGDNEPVTIKLLSFNDFHGNLNPPGSTIRAVNPADATKTVDLPAGGVEYLATLVKQLKAQNARTTVVAAGDLIGASPLVSALFHDEPAIETMNKLGLEFSSVGNHEFDDGSTELQRVQNGGCLAGGGNTTCQNGGSFPGAAFKYLAANVINNATNRPLFPGYAIKRFDVGGGQQIGVAFIGLVLRNTPLIVTPTGVAGLTFQDEATAANALIPEIKAAGVEAIVVLIHEGGATTGLFNDKTCPGLSGDILPIVDRLDPAIDVVISGHTHNAYNCVRNGRVLTSASSFGRVLTDMDLKLDRTTKDVTVDRVDNRIVVNDTAANPAPTAFPALAKDPEQTAILNVYNALVAPLAGQIVGSITADLTRTGPSSGETSLGDVIADAQLAATSAPEFGGAVVAFMNPGGIRADFLRGQISSGEGAGQITFGEAFTVQPFGNTLTTLTVTGAQLDTLLEQQFPPTQTAPRLLQVSAGFTYTYDASGPANAKVDASTIRINGVVVDPAATYRITVNNFLATGGDGFAILKQGTNQLGGAIDLDALNVYFAAKSPIAPGPVNRITRVN